MSNGIRDISDSVSEDYSVACVVIEVDGGKIKTVVLSSDRDSLAGRLAVAVIEAMKEAADDDARAERVVGGDVLGDLFGAEVVSE